MQWGMGFHSADGPAQAVAAARSSPFLTLVHLHKVDFALALTRSRRSRARQWSKTDIEEKLGWQNRIEDAAELRRYWQEDHDTCQPMKSGRLTHIPPSIKEALR